MFGNSNQRDESTPSRPAPATPRSSNSNQQNEGITAFLGPDTSIEGTLRFENSVLIEGKFKGRIESANGSLVIGEKAEVEADIEVGTASIRGTVTGSVNASQRVQLQGEGSLSGDLSTPSLQMDDSFTFEGSCSMPGKGRGQKASAPKPTQGKSEEREPVAV